MSGRFKKYYLPALVWAGLVALLLLTPGDPAFARKLRWWKIGFGSPWVDVLAHVVLLGTMGWLVARAFLAAGVKRAVAAAAVLTSLYGALLEIAQYFVPGRGTELLDIVVNALAATLGAWLTGKNGDTQL